MPPATSVPTSRTATASTASPDSLASPTRMPLRDSFGPLQVHNYRLYVLSQVLTNTSGWAARVAQDWLMLTLTGSTAMVGLTVALQFAPMVAFGLLGGVVADRLDRRTVLMVTQSVFGLSTGMVGLLTLSHHVAAWHILAAALLSGTATVFDNPARQAFVHEVAGPTNLRQAISLNSAVFQLGALVGPAVAGGLIGAFGTGWAFIVNASACLVAVTLLAAMHPEELTAAPVVARAKGQLREGLAYVRRTPTILWPVVLIGFVAVTGVNMATVLASYTATVFHNGASGYALLTSMLGLGAVTGALASTRRRRVRLRQLVLLAVLIGAAQLVLSTMSAHGPFLVLLVVLGAVMLLYITGGNTLVQTTVAGELRGRIMALYMLVSLGAQGASGLVIGWVSEHVGAHQAMAVCATGPLLGAVVVGWAVARSAGVRRPKDAARILAARVARAQAGRRSSARAQAGRRSSARAGAAASPVPTPAVSPAPTPAASRVSTAPSGSVPEPRRTSATPATTSPAPRTWTGSGASPSSSQASTTANSTSARATKDATRSPSIRTEITLMPNATAVGTVPTSSAGTSHDRCLPSTTTCVAGIANGSTPAMPSSPTVAAPMTIPAPASVTGGTASGRAVTAQ